MNVRAHKLSATTLGLVLLASVFTSGCHTTLGGFHPELCAPPVPQPRELAMTALPPYVIESPDILLINAVRLVPRGPYRIEPLDALLINVAGTLPDEPIAGIYTVEPEGSVSLGPRYGAVRVVGLTLEEARLAIEKHLKPGILLDPKIVVGLAQSRGLQQIRGEHLVGPDGTVRLGTYGSVAVAGMTLDMAKAAIEAHLSQYLIMPEISVDVFAYNSKVYYVIFDGGGYGEEILRLPITGNETVLDAIAHPQVAGLPAYSSTKKIWIARPNPEDPLCLQLLPVDWEGITKLGMPETNYQVLPGDRIYVKADFWISFDNFVAKTLSPFERMFGFTLLGSTTVNSIAGRDFSGQ